MTEDKTVADATIPKVVIYSITPVAKRTEENFAENLQEV